MANDSNLVRLLGANAGGVEKMLEDLMCGGASDRAPAAAAEAPKSRGTMSDAADAAAGPPGAAAKSMNQPVGTPDAPLPMGPGPAGTSFIDLLNRLRRGGLGDQVDSWVGDGPNRAIDAHEVTRAFGADQLSALASHAGVSTQTAARGIATALPVVVSDLTPHGMMPDQSAVPGHLHHMLG